MKSTPYSRQCRLTEFRYDRLNDHYRRAIHLADLIIKRVSFQLGLGSTAAPSFLVDMDRVFQDYVTAVFEEQAAREGLVRTKSAHYRLDTAGRISLTPDIVFRDRDGHVVAVIDAKYKRSDAQADYYQALAYAKGLGVKRVALIYPARRRSSARKLSRRERRCRDSRADRTSRPRRRGLCGSERRVGEAVRNILSELTPVPER